ncbi:MAG TPA: YjbQ family protein [Thermodesulfobacteriaceae bacterium]|nr:YjbQ family protein [Thermodesulfobacteriaceae bacterium]
MQGETVIYCNEIHVSLDRGPSIRDITAEIQDCVDRSRVNQGSLHATVTGSTGSLTTIEYEPGVVEDLKEAIARLAPPGLVYRHELAWHDGNGHSHVQAALLGPSLVLPVRKGMLYLGTWQQTVVINHDNRARERKVALTVMGTCLG